MKKTQGKGKGRLKQGVIVVTITVLMGFGGYMGVTTEHPRDDGVVISKLSLDAGRETEVVDVLKVTDGDTITVDYLGEEKKIRFIGIDTPETVHPRKPVEYYGKEASDFTKTYLDGKQVRLEFDEGKYDMYGRLLAYVYEMDGDMFNLVLLNRGYAKTSFYSPNYKYKELFLDVESKAQTLGIGIWNIENREKYETLHSE